MKNLTGIHTALVTPFKKGEVDYNSLRKLIRFQLEGGVDGLVVCGTTAESPTLETAEKEKIFQFIKAETAGAVTLTMGTGSYDTRETIKATVRAEEMGADATLIVVPYYNRPSQRGLLGHFKSIAQMAKAPLILYNVPSRTVAKLEAETIAELSNVNPIIGIKEATGDVAFGQAILQKAKPGFLLLSGDDGTFVNLCKAGGQGCISVISNILPKKTSEWCRNARTGKETDFQKYEQLNANLYLEPNPVPVKRALKLMGIIESDEMRLPLIELDSKLEPKLVASLKEIGLI